MRTWYIFKTAISAIIANKARSSLTVLGIVIGITSIILIMSIGQGAERLILNELQGFGADMIVIRPGKEPKGITDIAETIFSDSLKERDVEALKKKANVPHMVSIAPAIIVNGTASYLGETYKPTIFGWSAEFMGSIMNITPASGEFFDESDIKSRASVAVVGPKVVENLFVGGESALGKSIRIKDRSFRIVAILPKEGQAIFGDVDSMIILPYSTAQTYLAGTDFYNEIMLKVDDPNFVDITVADVEATLRESHNITDPTKDDFYVVTQKAAVEQIGAILSIFTLFLSSVVAISLVVGGIGVMNIMLVSVTERTREIGLRKAIGATDQNIMIQFLIEAVVLTGVGGVIGIIAGTFLALLSSFAIASVLNTNLFFVFPLNAAILGIGVSAAVGLVFGLYPARQASRKSPMEALRYE